MDQEMNIKVPKSCTKTCCGSEEVISIIDDAHVHDHDHNHNHSHGNAYFLAIISFLLLLSGLAMEHLWGLNFFKGWIKLTWYIIAYLPVAFPVLQDGFRLLLNGQVFTEFFLMTIATIGAFAIGEYPEAVAVMLFYTIGELFQAAAVNRSKNNIKALLDVRPKRATVFRNNHYHSMHPEQVLIGETIQVRVGEKVPLDGQLLSQKASLNTAALTGESKPQSILTGEKVLAGSINLEGLIEVKVEKLFKNSSIARILELVQNASARKSKTELLIRKLAKVYTPIVTYLAIAICVLPYFFVTDYQFSDWLYRALIFLVISCPCALVISIPLGYFGGLGAASKNGLLFKGATFLDQLTKVNILAMDKTGTVTKGVFKIKKIITKNNWQEKAFMQGLMAMEAKSTHPIAKAILAYTDERQIAEVTAIKEHAGKGLQGKIGDQEWLVGNAILLKEFDIEIPKEVENIIESIVLVAVNKQFAGYVIIADELKTDAKTTIQQLKKEGIQQIIMLSGDKHIMTQKVAKSLGIDQAKGALLPEDKLAVIENIQKDNNQKVAFIGDGINDAPVLAASDIGIAMGGVGSDVAIETADIIIQTDQPSKLVTGIKIARSTQNIIWQNIALAFGVKALVLILGAVGMATMWAAVFADVGVALLAILNAVRLQHMEW